MELSATDASILIFNTLKKTDTKPNAFVQILEIIYKNARMKKKYKNKMNSSVGGCDRWLAS